MRQLFRREALRGEPHQIGFGMAGAIPLSDHGILRFQKNTVIGVHEHGSKRMIAMCTGLPRD